MRGDGETADAGAVRGSRPKTKDSIERNLAELRRFVRRRLGPALRGRDDSMDIVQSTVRELLSVASRLDAKGDDALRRLMFEKASRKLVDRYRYHRARKRDAARERRPPEPGSRSERAAESPRAPDPTPSALLIAVEANAKLAAHLDRLTEDQRAVVVQCRILGLSHAEVAEVMCRTEDSVRNLLHRALARLSSSLVGDR